MKKEVTRKKCLNCGHEFTYRERLQSSYRLFWRMNCTECGARYSVLVRYRTVFVVLLALPLAFGPSLYDYLGWDVWNVLTFNALYFAMLGSFVLFVIPILPLKWDSAEEADTLSEEPKYL